jgi:hypothetical protein
MSRRFEILVVQRIVRADNIDCLGKPFWDTFRGDGTCVVVDDGDPCRHEESALLLRFRNGIISPQAVDRQKKRKCKEKSKRVFHK